MIDEFASIVNDSLSSNVNVLVISDWISDSDSPIDTETDSILAISFTQKLSNVILILFPLNGIKIGYLNVRFLAYCWGFGATFDWA